MAGLKDSYDRFVAYDPEGYDHPSLTKAFNDLAKSSVGRDILRYYRDELKGPIYVTNRLPPNVLGETTFSDIAVQPGVDAETLAHEMRHAYQNHAMQLHEQTPYNPFFNHIQTRMVEADAFSFACLNAITRWHEAGYKSVLDVTKNIPRPRTDNEAVYLMAFHAASLRNFDPDYMPQLMRKIFERYYGMIATDDREECYEQRAMDHSVRLYRMMDKYINPTMMDKAIRVGVMGLLTTTSLCSFGFGYLEPAIIGVSGMALKGWFDKSREHAASRITQDFNQTTKLIDDLAEKLGHIPGMKANYLTGTNDLKLSDPFFTHLMRPEHHAQHKEWQDKIQAGIDRRTLSSHAPK